MQITDLQIRLADDQNDSRLLAYISLVFDGCFTINDIKLIVGKNGPFVAMPQRIITDRCPTCNGRNTLRQRYCGHCKALLPPLIDDAKLFADVCFPITANGRKMIHEAVLKAYQNLLATKEITL